MRSNIYKALNLFISLLLPAFSSGQILISDLLTLNAGGVVYDVAYDQKNDGYFVVGNFTTVQGLPRTNICFIKASDYTVGTTPDVIPITAMNGEIRTVAIKHVWNPIFSNWDRHLFLGGNFSSLTLQAGGPQTRIGFAKLVANASGANFTLSGLNADMDMTPLITEGVNDIEIYGDTIMIAGEFLTVNQSTTNDYRDGLVAYSFSTNSLMAYPAISGTGTSFRRWMDVERINGAMYVTGDNDVTTATSGKIHKLNSSGAIDPTFNYVSVPLMNSGYRVCEVDDSLLALIDDWNAADDNGENVRILRCSNGTLKTDHDFSPVGGIIGGVGGSKTGVNIYKNFMFVSSSVAGNGVSSYEFTGSGPVSAPNWNAGTNSNLTESWYGNIHRSRNVLFVSALNLTTLSGFGRLRLGAYCLAPSDPVNFTAFDSTICPGDIVTFTVPAVATAEGYLWQYSGNGADINLTGAPENLYCVIPSPTGNSVQVEFTDIFSPGQLTVRAYSRCNGNIVTSDTLFSEALPINIWSNPVPNANAGNDTSLTCVVNSILLSGSTDSSGCTLEWLNPGPFGNTIGYDTLATVNDDYMLKVTNAIGCFSTDTVSVNIDTLTPDIIIPPGPYELTCSDSVLVLLGSTSVIDSTTWWKNVVSGASLLNPVSINVLGNYRYVVQNNQNGCIDSSEIVVTLNQPIPNIKVMGYPDLIPSEPLDTITCIIDSLFLTGYSDSVNTIADWTLADTSVLAGVYSEVTLGGNYYLLVTDTVTGCTNFTTINIAQFTSPPDVVVPSSGLLNCSYDSLVLDGSSTIIGATLEWSGLPIIPGPDPLTVDSAGTYYLTVTRPDNGCSSIDSVVVNKDLSITVIAGSDTLVCDGFPVSVNGSYIGIISGISFLWNNGATTPGTNFTAGLDSTAVLEVSGAGGCFGSDTMSISVPPVPVMDIEPFAPCDDANSGQLVITPLSGLDPFSYSLDGGTNVQSSNVFAGLPVGIFTVTVFDSLNCAYDFTATIDQNSSSPNPEFLVSTYNFASDTIALVNVSSPPPDSVSWVITAPLVLLDENIDYALVAIPDTGSFGVEMIAWFGSCEATVSKIINAAFPDSAIATTENNNGIRSAVVYPNPSSGTFTVEVEFYKSQRCAMLVTDMTGLVYGSENFAESLIITKEFEMPAWAVNGTYVLRIVSEFDYAFITFVLNK